MSWLGLRPDISNPHVAHAFHGKGNDIFALVSLSRDVDITFNSAADARAVAAACTEAAEALDRLGAEGTAPEAGVKDGTKEEGAS